LIVRKGVLEKYREKDKENEIKVKEKYTNELNLTGKVEMSREDAIKCVLEKYNGAIVSTTGKASRELFEEREKIGEGHERDFLTVGSMGCASAIGLGIAVSRDKEVYVFDGDGSALMQMGSFATIGSLKLKNLKHIIFDNQAYDSTGGQRTVSGNVDFGVVALGCGYDKAITVDDKDGLGKALDEEGLCLIRVLVKKGARKDLGRPTTSTFENKKAFMEYLRK
jgi:phosphonopyruvate decarboxylase